MPSGNQFINLGHIMPVASSDLNGDDSTAKCRAGVYSYVVDAFGTRIFHYVRNLVSSTIAKGSLTQRFGDIAISNITAGTTTSATKVAGFTANKQLGEMAYVLDNDDSAGAAPEGEVSIIASNTADVINVDPSYPFTVALAANDDLSIISPGWHVIASVIGALAQEVKGVVVGVNGISTLNYGWIQCYGICPIVNLKASTGFTARVGIIADTAAIAASAGAWELCIGYSVTTVTSDIVSDKAPAFLNLYSPTLNEGTP